MDIGDKHRSARPPQFFSVLETGDRKSFMGYALDYTPCSNYAEIRFQR